MRGSSSPRLEAFTRLELVVLVLVVGLVAFVVGPITHRRPNGVGHRLIPAQRDAQDILVALTLYAGDHGGLFPTGTVSSNEAFRKLFPDVCDNEAMFWLQGDRAFCNLKSPDYDISEGKVLEPGENHWAYVSGLDEAAPMKTPIVMDGFTAQGYRYDKSHVWWKSDRAIVAFVDGSVQSFKIEDGVLTLPNSEGTGSVPIEQLPSLKGKTILNPERPLLER